MITSTYPRLAHDWLKHETDRAIGRELGTLASGEGKVDTGTVLGKVTASGEYVVCDLGRDDGGETAAAILLDYHDATDAAQPCVVLIGFAEVTMATLIFHASFDTLVKKKAAMALLDAKHIRNRGIA